MSERRFSSGMLMPLCVGLFVVVTVLRLIVSNPIEGVGYLYTVPIALLAAERGWRAGLTGAFAAVTLSVMWSVLQDFPLGVIGYLTRSVTFVAVGMLVGLYAGRRCKLEEEREQLLRELHATAMRDQLTGLPNRRSWDERFRSELSRASRSDRPLSVAAIDIDHLKQVNDTAGHHQGDRLIERCARGWREALRETDFLARLGGDEFLALLPDCPAADAEEVARRVLESAHPGDSFSIGLATWDGREAGFELIHRADHAMYAAKAAGGGRFRAAVPASAVAANPGA